MSLEMSSMEFDFFLKNVLPFYFLKEGAIQEFNEYTKQKRKLIVIRNDTLFADP